MLPCLCTVRVLEKDVEENGRSVLMATRVNSGRVIEIGLQVAFISCGGVTKTTCLVVRVN